jgi:hypothetical protein
MSGIRIGVGDAGGGANLGIGRTLSWSSCADVGCFGVNRATCGNHVLVHHIIR